MMMQEDPQKCLQVLPDFNKHQLCLKLMLQPSYLQPGTSTVAPETKDRIISGLGSGTSASRS